MFKEKSEGQIHHEKDACYKCKECSSHYQRADLLHQHLCESVQCGVETCTHVWTVSVSTRKGRRKICNKCGILAPTEAVIVPLNAQRTGDIGLVHNPFSLSDILPKGYKVNSANTTSIQPEHTSNKGSVEPYNVATKKEETSSKLEVSLETVEHLVTVISCMFDYDTGQERDLNYQKAVDYVKSFLKYRYKPE